MVVTHPSIFQILRRFPEKRQKILRCFKSNESFRILCEDYKQCDKALRFWSRVDSGESLLRKAEYEELLQSLECEILLYAENSDLKCEEV